MGVGIQTNRIVKQNATIDVNDNFDGKSMMFLLLL
jgi:hypothetical protein